MPIDENGVVVPPAVWRNKSLSQKYRKRQEAAARFAKFDRQQMEAMQPFLDPFWQRAYLLVIAIDRRGRSGATTPELAEEFPDIFWRNIQETLKALHDGGFPVSHRWDGKCRRWFIGRRNIDWVRLGKGNANDLSGNIDLVQKPKR